MTSKIWVELMERAQAFVLFDQESVPNFLARSSAITLNIWHRHEAVLIAAMQARAIDDQLAAIWSHRTGQLANLIVEQVERDQKSGCARPVVTICTAWFARCWR